MTRPPEEHAAMAEIRTVRTARIHHGCDAYPCENPIRPGEQYLVASLPPSDEGNGTDHWLVMKVCRESAEQYGQTMAEQVTPRQRPARRRTRPARRVEPLRTVPSRPFRDEPALHRPITTVHLPAANIPA
ncbi:hypothetical protein [Micromonospora sp. WMMC250]|uniref:hypothetical protein n=1 Tax=Micromonospora sp. WMMC250 TaxID=3014781 RepID=UPI0022B71037|nr:hypothetical protein [Micromonospora sp. WMMC250]MCZ7376526.1 hypothetical protein [Micromonospora sp. WMMC250]